MMSRELVQKANDVPEVISLLEQFDNKHGCGMTHEQVFQQLLPIVDAIVKRGEELLPYLHELIKYEETWSSHFALTALKGIKSSLSTKHLIDFITRTYDSDYWDCGEEAMLALTAIGTPAIKLLLQAVSEMLVQKQCNTYLIGALTRIKDETVFSYMVSVLEDYTNNPKKYAGWFSIETWCFDFTDQGHKEVLPLLKKVLAMPNTTEYEQIEIKDTIDQLEDPEEWERNFQKDLTKINFKIGRNEPCPCGSGKKYKKCCMSDS